MSGDLLSVQAKIDRKMAQQSLYYLCKEILGYRDMVPQVHGPMCDFSTNPLYGRFRQGCVPRSHFKTWVWTVGKSIWLTLPDEEGLFRGIYPFKGPNIRILIASNVIDNAAKMIRKIKNEWESNERLKAAFPELIPDFNKTRWSDHCAEVKRSIKATEGTYTAVGAGGSVISQHFDHIIEDDLIYAKKDDFTGQELMPSQEDIDNAIGWHKLTFSLLADPSCGTMDNVGTRWAPKDLIDYIRHNEFHYKCFEYNPTKDNLWPIPDDSYCNWPERYNKATLESIRNSQGSKIFETQYLNRPRAGDEVAFNMAYVNKHQDICEFPSDARMITVVDLATWKDKKRICNNVILTGCKTADNHLWVARVNAGKFNPTEVITHIKSHQKQFNSKVYIEEVAYQVALRHFARKDMEAEGSQRYSIEALPPDNRKGAKELRIEALQPIVETGAFHCLASMANLLQEMEDYPYCSTRDILDILGFLWRYAKPAGIARPKTYENPLLFDNIVKAHMASMPKHGLPYSHQLKSFAGSCKRSRSSYF